MSIKYVPSVGHKIGATLGENHLVGVVDSVTSRGILGLDLELAGDCVFLDMTDPWVFRRIQELPTGLGAVVQTPEDGQVYVLVDPEDRGDESWFIKDSYSPRSGGHSHWVTSEALKKTEFTVISEGVILGAD
ncbi:MAG: hypothetical protein ACRC5T_03270 [Cetobacterium sp.]